MNKDKASVLTLLLIVGLVITAIPLMSPETLAATPVGDTTFSIMQISDLQHLPFLNPQLYYDTTSWIVNNSANYNLKMVINTGDFIDYGRASPPKLYNESEKAQQWAVANASLSKLLNAGIPYCWGAGNHDQTPFGNSNGTMTGSNYLAFNATYMRSKSYWVDDLYDSKNTAVKFAVNNYPFLIINLEFLANSSAIAWMKGLLDKNNGSNVIITTHDYLNANGNLDNSSATATWTMNFRATLDSYPNIFLALCGHIHGWNMTRVGHRQEILFDRQEANNQTGAASVRIYTFNLTDKKVNASTYCLDTKTWLTDSYNQFSFDASLTSDWTLVHDGRAIKAYPDLREYIWQKDARMLPNGQYDKIALHRLVKTGITPKGVVFMNHWVGFSADQLISNPPEANWTIYENVSQALYWANRGFDVYSIDYRNGFVPPTLNLSQLSFMADWGIDVYMSDLREAILKTKEVSGAQKMFITDTGLSYGAMNYAAKYGKEDLRGIIMLGIDTSNLGSAPIGARIGIQTNTYNATKVISDANSKGNWSDESSGWYNFLYAANNPGAPNISPITGQPMGPPLNPMTNKSWTNITEFLAYALYMSYGPGGLTNTYGGYADPTTIVQFYAGRDRYRPWTDQIERRAMWDWVNCPYVTYDYDDHWSEISVPMLVFASEKLDNRTGQLRLTNGISNNDFTGIYLKNYGWLDVYCGKYSARDVSEPAYQWMMNHLTGVEKGDPQGTYRDWKIYLYQNQIYIAPPQTITAASPSIYIGTWDPQYYATLGKTIVDVAKPAIDECISGCK